MISRNFLDITSHSHIIQNFSGYYPSFVTLGGCDRALPLLQGQLTEPAKIINSY
jgi:hypothetical protein